MAGTRTNSNSITAILIEKLNNKKTGFRQEMLKQWGFINANIEFEDGTYTSITDQIPEMGNKRVDIIGYENGTPKILIEVKASKGEPLQKSQMKKGEYEKVAKNHPEIKLIYIIPEEYDHLKQLPPQQKNIIHYYWKEIYSKAYEYDNTGFTKNIEYFVENIFDNLDSILTKEDAVTFLNPQQIGEILSQYQTLKDYIYDLSLKTTEDDFGFQFDWSRGKKKIKVWLGLYSLGDRTNDFLFIYTNDYWLSPKYKINHTFKNRDCFIEGNAGGHSYFFPLRNQNKPISDLNRINKEDFSKLIEYNLNKVFDFIS